jgi:hypothetical protein
MIKRTVVIVILWLTVPCLTAFAQTTVCDDSAIMSLKGKWTTQHAPRPSPKEITNEQYLQVTKRADAVHPLLLEAYPELVGIQEGRWWHGSVGPSSFAPGLLAYYYVGGLSQYFCAPNASPDSILGKLGAPSNPVYVRGAAETNLMVHFNEFAGGFLSHSGMTVDGLQVFDRPRPAGTWKGYELYVPHSNRIEKDGLVMLTRKGMLPYRPVTRKQYIDYVTTTIQRRYDETIAAAKMVLQNPDASRVPEFAEGAQRSLADAAKIRDEAAARCQEALKKNATDNTLNAPAIAEVGSENVCGVFTTEERGGQALVTVNPDYFRKDLPPYVPQFIVVHWQSQVGVASSYFKKMVEANFPIEKLQAMIDK